VVVVVAAVAVAVAVAVAAAGMVNRNEWWDNGLFRKHVENLCPCVKRVSQEGILGCKSSNNLKKFHPYGSERKLFKIDCWSPNSTVIISMFELPCL